jgi:hypothetical protein
MLLFSDSGNWIVSVLMVALGLIAVDAEKTSRSAQGLLGYLKLHRSGLGDASRSV